MHAVWQVVATVLLLCGLLGRAGAQPEQTGRVLFVGVRDEQGKLSPGLTGAFRAKLSKRVELAAAANVNPSERDLGNPEALLALGQRAGVPFVLIGEARAQPDQSYALTVQLFQVNSLQVWNEAETCAPCDAQERRVARLMAMSERLLSKHQVPMLAPEVVASPPPPPPPPPPDRRPIAIGVFGGVAGVALATAIALTVLTYDPGSRQHTGNVCTGSDGLPYECFTSYLPGLATAYAVTGLATAALVLTLTWPRHKPKEH